MRYLRDSLIKGFGVFVILTLLCGVIYPLGMTGLSQILFKNQANGSMITIDGTTYGSALVGQNFYEDRHLWGRINLVQTVQDTDGTGKWLAYGKPSNISPASDEYRELIRERVAQIQKTNPDATEHNVPLDLVTASGSGLDPHISPLAAQYQVPRLVKATGKSADEIEKIIAECTQGRFLGVFGEKTVNVLKVNLMLDGLLKP